MPPRPLPRAPPSARRPCHMRLRRLAAPAPPRFRSWSDVTDFGPDARQHLGNMPQRFIISDSDFDDARLAFQPVCPSRRGADAPCAAPAPPSPLTHPSRGTRAGLKSRREPGRNSRGTRPELTGTRAELARSSIGTRSELKSELCPNTARSPTEYPAGLHQNSAGSRPELHRELHRTPAGAHRNYIGTLAELLRTLRNTRSELHRNFNGPIQNANTSLARARPQLIRGALLPPSAARAFMHALAAGARARTRPG